MKNSIAFKIIYLEKNQGHGNARRVGLSNCSNELVALMDSDDISLPNRFYYQLNAFANNPNLDIVGGQITEFIEEPRNIIGKRVVPEKHEDIKKYMKKRCPMNQVSVMFKKSSVLRAGGYLDWYCEEDYYLWIRMFLTNSIFANVSQTLVNVRVGNEMSARRGGMKYFNSEKRIQKLLLKKHFISFFRYVFNVTIRFFGEVVLSSRMRARVFKKIRKKDDLEDECQILKTDFLKHDDFSVSMCVYNGDNADWFDAALSSIYNQSIKPNEIVLVVDGPVNDNIMGIIKKWEEIMIYGIRKKEI